MDGCTIDNDINRITFLLDGLAGRLIKELDTPEQRRQAGLEIYGIEQGLKKIKEICQKD